MSSPMQCSECNKAYDFNREAWGWCRTCNKQEMCEQCCYAHECTKGKSRQFSIIINPSWIANLRSEYGGTARFNTSDGRTVNMADELNRLEEM